MINVVFLYGGATHKRDICVPDSICVSEIIELYAPKIMEGKKLSLTMKDGVELHNSVQVKSLVKVEDANKLQLEFKELSSVW